MVNFCGKCGEKAKPDAKFCTNCGANLTNYEKTSGDVSNQNNTADIAPFVKESKLAENGYVETNSCPFCHNPSLDHYKQKKMGLLSKDVHICESCGAELQDENNKFKLINFNNKNSNIWQRYHNQKLSKEEWIRIGNGGLSDSELEIKERERQAEIARLKKQINDQAYLEFKKSLVAGTFDVPTISDAPIMLKKGEEAILYYENVSFREARAVRNSVSRYAGTSGKAMGIPLRSGMSATKSESHDEIRAIDTGTLTVTTKRLVFTGKIKNVNIPLNKIMSMTPYTDGIAVRSENKQKTQYFVNIGGVNFNYNIGGHKFKSEVNGTVLKCLIQGLLKK